MFVFYVLRFLPQHRYIGNVDIACACVYQVFCGAHGRKTPKFAVDAI
jgi:hypothetical protein